MDNHTLRSAVSVFPLLLAMAAGCGDTAQDFIDVQGSYADGKPVALHEQSQRFTCCRADKVDPKTGLCIATASDPPCVSLEALRLLADKSDWFRGLRISFTPSKTTPKMTYESALSGPVTVYAVRATDSAFVDTSINGGQVQFTSIAQERGGTTAGTFGKMIVVQQDQSGGVQTLLTIDKGSFQYIQP